jgi:hypothetical protein
MCGISAYISEYKNGFTLEEVARFKILTWITQLRGGDSTGIVQYASKSGLDSIKRLNGPSGLFAQDEYRVWETKLMKEGKLAFSHCRAATKGTVTIENAHPFYIPRDRVGQEHETGITLIHNGTLHYQSTLPGYGRFDVDSKWLAHCIATYGAEEALAAIDGPISSMWFDSKDNTFNVFTNGERPLAWTQTKGGAVVFNSEAPNLTWMLDRAGEEFDQVQDVPKMELWTFSAPDYTNARVTKITKRPTVVSHYGGLYGEYDDGYTVVRQGHYVPSASTNDDNEYYALKRGIEEDCKLMWDGKILSVRFFKEYNGVTRNTLRKGGITHKSYNTEPYKEGLVSLVLDPQDPKVIIMQQLNKEGTIEVLRFPCPEAPVTNGKVIELPNRQSGRSWAVPNVKFRKGKNINFTHEAPGGGKVKHQARCDPVTPEHFTWYQNNTDGIVKAGDQVFMEHFEIEERNKFNAVYGFRVYPEDRQDLHIEYVFFDTRHELKELKQFDMYTGKVAYIRLNTKERYNGSSNIVQVIMTDVRAVDTKEFKEKADAPAIH